MKRNPSTCSKLDSWRGFVGAAAVALGAGILAPSCSSTPVGASMYGMHCLLEKEGQPVGEESQAAVDRIAELVTQSIREGSGDQALGGRPRMSEELPEIAREAIRRAIEESKQAYAESRPDIVEAIQNLRVEEIQFRWKADPIGQEDVGHGHSQLLAHSNHFDNLGLCPLEDGKTFFAEVGAQAIPWPRKEGYTPAPAVILAQSSVVWHSRALGAWLIAKSLSQVMAERVAKRLELAAGDHGLEVSSDL